MEIVRVSSINELQKTKIGQAFSHAFLNEPNFIYIIPNDDQRSKALQWFFGSFVVRLGMLYGEVFIPKNNGGGAIWIKPNRRVKFMGALQAGLLKMPFYFGFNGIKRSMKLSNYVEKIREEYAPEQHWYLMALAVAPNLQGKGIGSALIHNILLRTDKENIACYLETFSQSGVNFYNKLGFEVLQKHQVPQEGPSFWSMGRKPAH